MISQPALRVTTLSREKRNISSPPTYLSALEVALIPQPSIFVFDILELSSLGRVYRASPAGTRRLGAQANHASNAMTGVRSYRPQCLIIVGKLYRRLHEERLRERER